jgi:hypothetical protein
LLPIEWAPADAVKALKLAHYPHISQTRHIFEELPSGGRVRLKTTNPDA